MPRSTASIVTLSFPGKSGKRALIEIDDGELAAVMTELAAGRPRSALLSYADAARRRVPLTPADVNSHVRSLTGGAFTAKDFRTLRGTIFAAETLARIGTVDTAKDRQARGAARGRRDRRGAREHARGGARAATSIPRVWKAYQRGELLDLAVSPESAIQRLILG